MILFLFFREKGVLQACTAVLLSILFQVGGGFSFFILKKNKMSTPVFDLLLPKMGSILVFQVGHVFSFLFLQQQKTSNPVFYPLLPKMGWIFNRSSRTGFMMCHIMSLRTPTDLIQFMP